MGNKSSTTQYFINSDHINTNQTQTDTTHIPVDVTTNVNPGKFDGTTDDLKKVYSYISNLNVANNGSPIDEIFDFDNFVNMHADIYLAEEIQKAKLTDDFDEAMELLEIELLERGVLGSFYDKMSGLISGRISVSQNFIKMINSATSRITAVSKSTLGEGITTRLLDGMRKSAPSLKRFMDEVYSGLVDDNHTHLEQTGIEQPGVVTSRALYNSGMLGSTRNNWLPPNYTPRSGSSLTQLRSELLRRGDNTDNFRQAYAKFQNILTGNDKVQLNLTSNISGQSCFECPAAALMSEQHPIGINTGAEVIGKIVPAMMMAELSTVTAKANLAACTASSPSIANTPSEPMIARIINELPIEYQPAAAESVRQDGARYGLTIIDTSDVNNEAIPDSDVMQMLLDYTPVNTKDGANVRNIRLMKENYQRIFPEGVHIIESLIASPSDISLRDVPVPLAADIPWSDPLYAIKNNMGGGVWETPMDPSNQGYYKGSPWLSTGVNAVNMASGATVFFKYRTSGQKFISIVDGTVWDCACGLGCNFKLKPIYSDYNIIFNLTLSYWELNNSNNCARPGIFLINDSEIHNDKPIKAFFIPATRQGDSMLYTISIATENCVDAIANNLFGASGIFTIGVGWNFDERNFLGPIKAVPVDPYAFSVSIIDGNASLSRNGQSSNLNNWVVNGISSKDTLVSNIFTVTMLDEVTSHPADISHFWRSTVSPLFSPYLRSIIELVKDGSTRLAIAGITTHLKESAIHPEDFDSYENVVAWLQSVISEFNSWMLWRGQSPWVKIKTDCIPKLAWCVVCLMRSFVMMTIYLEPNSQTVTSAMKNLSIMFNDVHGTLSITNETRDRMAITAKRSKEVEVLGSMRMRGTNTSAQMLRLLNEN